MPNGHDKRFTKLGFTLPEDSDRPKYIIQYLGDETVHKDYPHGNSKKQTKIFIPTKRSVLDELKEKLTHDIPSKVYKAAIQDPRPNTEDQITTRPRNEKQVSNLRQKELEKSRISNDAIVNVHELAYEYDDFIWSVTTHPDLLITCGHAELLREMEFVCTNFKSKDIQLSIDTTFSMGECYVTPLLFKHIGFYEQPTIPAVLLLHVSRRESDYCEIFNQLTKR